MIESVALTKSFKNIVAVNNINLNIYAGEFVALLGPNGAGKTTLIEMIEGLQKPDSGKILIQGKSWKKNGTALRRILGISLQETKFFDRVTVYETLELFACFYGQPRARAREVLELIQLQEKEKSYTMNLSGGQRQRLALGLALVNRPEILLLDEPTTGLDPTARREIWKVIQHLKEQGTTLILTTHYMEEAEFLCNRILIMDHGKFLAQGTLAELLKLHGEEEFIHFAAASPFPAERVQKLPGVLRLEFESEKLRGRLVVRNITLSLPLFLELLKQEKIALLELECHRKTLDDLFVQLTGRRLADADS